MHLQSLQQVTLDVLPDQLLRLRTRERNIALVEERSNVSLCNLGLGIHPVLQLPQPLGREPQLGLFRGHERRALPEEWRDDTPLRVPAPIEQSCRASS